MRNACIAVISSRKKCLIKHLDSVHKFFNKKYNYPVYVFYFDDIYDDENYREEVFKVNPNVKFVSVPYSSPEHVPEKEMFYNQKQFEYVNKGGFTIKRKGYLHMCNFWINFYEYPNTEFNKYDYLLVHDDESGYIKHMVDNPFELLDCSGEKMGALICGKRLKNGKPHQGHYDTRHGLWEFTKDFCKNNGIVPGYVGLRESLNGEEDSFHYLPWSDSYVFNLSIFKSEDWELWVKSVNESGGVYRYRWGDNEIISLFYMIFNDNPIFNLKIVEDGFHDQGKFRRIQDIAPSIKDLYK